MRANRVQWEDSLGSAAGGVVSMQVRACMPLLLSGSSPSQHRRHVALFLLITTAELETPLQRSFITELLLSSPTPQFDRKDVEMNKLVVCGMKGAFRVYDMRTQHPTEGFARHTEKVSGCTTRGRSTQAMGLRTTQRTRCVRCLEGARVHYRP